MKHLRPNSILFMLFCFVGCDSCKAQLKSDQLTDSLENSEKIIDLGLGIPKTSLEMKSYLDAGMDPYFVESKDTISVYGPKCIVRNLIQDRSGNYWLASWNGIIKYDGKIFTNYTLKEGLIRFHVTTVFEDSKGNIWFGHARGGVYRYNGTHFTLFTTKDGLPDNTANCITEDATGNIWFGTENGVSRFDGMRFSNFTEEDGLNDHFINAILRDKNGKIWIGTNKGMNCYDGKSFTNFTDRDHFPPQKVASLFEDSKNNIWIGCNATQVGGKGLCRFDGKSVHYSIRPYFVMYLCEDKNKALWFAHNKGAEHPNFALYRYDGNSFSTITQQNQIDNPVIFGIIEDNKGSIWFGTSKGVCRYDGTSFNYFRKIEDR